MIRSMILACLVLAVSVNADAATIIVSPGQTISSGVSSAATHDTVLVQPGTYEGFLAKAGVTVRSAVPHEAKITSNIIVPLDADGAMVDGFYVKGGGIIVPNTGSGRTQASTTPTGVSIINNHCYGHSGYLFFVVGANWLIEGNTFEKVIEQDYGRMFGTGHVFRRNLIFGTTYGVGKDVEPNGEHVDVIQWFGNNDGILRDCVFEFNFVTDFFQGFFIADEDSNTDIQNLTIRDNVFWGQPMPDTGNFHGRPSWAICVGKNAGGTNVRIEHNLIYNVANATGMRGGHVNGYVGNNLLVNCGTNYSSYSGDITRAGDFTRNPEFANASNPLGADGIPFTADDGWRPTAAAAEGYGPRLGDAPPLPSTPNRE